MDQMILRGEPAKLASLNGRGYGYGYGYGSGSGDGSGYGDGDGYGSGSGYGYGYGSGDGDGYGYGYGDGSGYGDGYGYGYGYGYGSGDGYGDGYGYGYGSGDGYGDGSGYGDGYGYGSGSGSGDGYGYGSGDGYGSREYWLATIDYFASKWPEALRLRLAALRQQGVPLAFWRSDSQGQPANNGGRIETAAPGVVHTAPGPLNICNSGTLHATVIPPKWKGERWWIVAMLGDVQWQNDKCGALTREIIGEAV